MVTGVGNRSGNRSAKLKIKIAVRLFNICLFTS